MTDVLKRGEIVARNVTLATFLLALVKLVVGLITSSIAILADAFHSFSDLIPVIAAWIGLKIAQRPKTEEFPYGYYKAENLAALFASLFIFLLGFEILKEAISRISVQPSVTNDYLGIAAIILSLGVSYILYKYQMKAAKETGSQALMANALETRMDLLSTVIVFVGFAAAMFHVMYVESLVGILLSLLIFHAGYESAVDALKALMDAGVEREELEKFVEIVKSVPRVKKVKSIVARKSGPFVFVEVSITVPSNLDVKQAHSVADEVERSLKRIGAIDHVVVHFEPDRGKRVVARPVNEDGSLAKVFGSAPYFDLFEVSGRRRKKLGRIKNPGFGLSKKRGVKAALALIDRGVDVVEVKNIGKDSKEILENAGVEVRVVRT